MREWYGEWTPTPQQPDRVEPNPGSALRGE